MCSSSEERSVETKYKYHFTFLFQSSHNHRRSRKTTEVTSRRASVFSEKSSHANNSINQGDETFVPAGQNLIEDEKAEVGGVKWTVYAYYTKSIGVWMCVRAVVLYIGFQVRLKYTYLFLY